MYQLYWQGSRLFSTCYPALYPNTTGYHHKTYKIDPNNNMFVVKIKDNSHETATGAIWIISILKSLLFLFYPWFTTVQLIYIALTTHASLSPIRRGFAPGFLNNKKGALD